MFTTKLSRCSLAFARSSLLKPMASASRYFSGDIKMNKHELKNIESLPEEIVDKFKKQSLALETPGIYDYIHSVGRRTTDIKQQLIADTKKHFGNLRIMTTSELQGEFMQNLVKTMNAKKCIEVGVFTGYSALCLLQGMPDDGHLLALDLNDTFTNLAEKYWEKAGVSDKVTLELGPAAESLQKRLDAGEAGTYDLIYIDADKENEKTYYEQCLELLRPGGALLIDNTLFAGFVAHDPITEPNAKVINELNQGIVKDERVHVSMLPMADGIYFLVKK